MSGSGWPSRPSVGCAAAPAKPAVTRDPCAKVEPVFPDPEVECVGVAATPAGAPPSCVPAFARGRELARDDQLHMVVYEACLPESRYAVRAPVRVDPRGAMIERSGERPASRNELDVIAGRLGLDRSTREPELALGPQVSACRQDRWKDDDRCLRLHLLARQPALPPLMTALSKLMPIESVCIPMKVQFGVREGCPTEDDLAPEVPQRTDRSLRDGRRTRIRLGLAQVLPQPALPRLPAPVPALAVDLPGDRAVGVPEEGPLAVVE